MVNASDLDKIVNLYWRYKKVKRLLDSFDEDSSGGCALGLCGDEIDLTSIEALKVLRDVLSTIQSELYSLGVKV